MQYVPAYLLVETIRELDEKFEHFHLSTCVCGAPMWQQPCQMCGYYSQQNDNKLSESNHLTDSCTKLRFVKAVHDSGNFLEFYFRSFYECLDPQHDKLNDVKKLSIGLIWTDPEEIWDYYKRADVNSLGSTNE